MTIRRIGNPSKLAAKLLRVPAAVESAFDEIEEKAVNDFELSQQTFRNKSPINRSRFDLISRRIELPGKIYGFVDHGTRPHRIKAKRAATLAFPTGYKRKTRKGRIAAGQGGPSGGTAFAKEVKHPGSRAGKMSETIRKRYDILLPRAVQKRIRRAIR